MSQAHAQQQQQSQPRKDLPSEFHVYVCLEGEFEAHIARAYMQKTYPGSKARLVQELRLHNLSRQHIVIALWRDRGCTTAVFAPRDEQSGARGLEIREPETLIGEVLEGKPLHVKDFWGEGAESDDELSMTALTDGELDRNAFLQALGTSMSKCHVSQRRAKEPAIIKRSTDQRSVRLGK